uniref:RRM domain-containing protein n=1 Tax=Panagrolaimus davidi TaxID=227884 RepID=A0A914PM43_9BILA
MGKHEYQRKIKTNFRSDYRNGGGGGDRYRDSGRRGGYGDRRGGGGYGDRSRGGGGRPRNHEARENPRLSNCLGIFGFGFVNFEERSDATKAREKITETMIDGMTVRVDYAIQNRAPPRNRSPDARRRSPPSSRARYSRSPSR